MENTEADKENKMNKQIRICNQRVSKEMMVSGGSINEIRERI